MDGNELSRGQQSWSWSKAVYRHTGINMQIETPDDPLKYFELFMIDDIIQSVVTETNRRYD